MDLTASGDVNAPLYRTEYDQGLSVSGPVEERPSSSTPHSAMEDQIGDDFAVSGLAPSFGEKENKTNRVSKGVLHGRQIIAGTAEGDVLASSISLSFWGGVNPENGMIIDQHHPLVGQSVTGKILAIPGGRGSCSGSGVMLELLLNERQASALIFEREEMILTLGVIVAQEMFGKSIPILQVSRAQFEKLSQWQRVRIIGGQIQTEDPGLSAIPRVFAIQQNLSPIQLTSHDREKLDGSHGKAVQIAMRVILRTAQTQGVTELIDVKQAHIDCCIYTGPATLRFAKTLCEWDARVCIPTSLNSISIDRRLWRSQGVDPAFAEPSEELAQTYLEMGARPTFTCAPYLLDSAPKAGEHIMWAESNAVVFANSVLGARTIKGPDFLDVCVALTGRTLNTGCHIDENRKARVQVHAESLCDADDTLFPLLGYVVGDIAADQVPIITGLEKETPTTADLKAFGAAFATTSSAPMFHIAGITIEARSLADIEMHLTGTRRVTVTRSHLTRQWLRFNGNHSEEYTRVDLISLGNPHFSYDEIVKLANLCAPGKKHEDTALVVTCSRDTYSQAYQDGHIAHLEGFGAQILTDTCWCMIHEPVVPTRARTIMTNSAKYAHYGTGLTGRQMRFGGLSACVDAAFSGRILNHLPVWLGDFGTS